MQRKLKGGGAALAAMLGAGLLREFLVLLFSFFFFFLPYLLAFAWLGRILLRLTLSFFLSF